MKNILIISSLSMILLTGLNANEIEMTGETAFLAYQKMICGTTEEGVDRKSVV